MAEAKAWRRFDSKTAGQDHPSGNAEEDQMSSVGLKLRVPGDSNYKEWDVKYV